jgi:hypothetical protein
MTHVLDPLEVSAIHRVEVKFLDAGRSRGSQYGQMALQNLPCKRRLYPIAK